MTAKTIDIYRIAEHRYEVCSLGEKHRVPVYVKKTIVDSGTTFLDDDGYTKERRRIFVDDYGVLFKEHRAFDSGRQYFVEDSKDHFFWDPAHYVPERYRF